MKIVVNSGNIGTPLAVQLAKAGHEVTLAVRQVEANAEWDRLKIKQAPFDMNSTQAMENILREADAFFSLTPLVQNMVEVAINAVQSAKRVGVKRIVRSSAAGAGPNAGIELGRMHFEVEKAVEASGIPFTILRPMNFMQNFLNFGNAEVIKAKSTFYAPLGNAKLSIVDTRDVSEVAARCLTDNRHLGKRYELTGGDALSNQETADVFSRVLDRKINYVDVPESVANEGMAKAGMPSWLVKLLSELNAVGKAGYLTAVSPDVEKILGRKPTSFEKFVRDHASRF